MVDAIFHAYFEEAVNISKLSNLEKIGAAILGDTMPQEQLKEFLEGEELRAEIQQEISSARQNSVTGVPAFTIVDPVTNKGNFLSGAQPPERFAHTFAAIQKKAVTGNL
mmetsp:Transcript_7182/g.8886  ORF Transcript_7182/g.8886 Transcript_7182/m.8886 type:complete len:109 (-) Transcript_7182:372-698(-)